jgi:hypothetical protein
MMSEGLFLPANQGIKTIKELTLQSKHCYSLKHNTNDLSSIKRAHT